MGLLFTAIFLLGLSFKCTMVIRNLCLERITSQAKMVAQLQCSCGTMESASISDNEI